MMRSLLPLLLLISTSAYAAVPIKWSEAMVKDLNTKTVRQAFCEKNVGYQAKAGCDYFSKEKGALDKKVSSAHVEGSSLFISVGRRQVEIKSTAEPTQFEINRKIIDLKDYRDPAALEKVLRATFPKVAAGSRWVNVAYAEEDTTPYELMTVSALMLQGTFDERWCGYAEKFIRACDTNLSTAPEKTQWENITKKIKNKMELNENDVRWIEDDVGRLALSAYQMESQVDRLNKNEIMSSLKRCPSSNQPPLANAQEDVQRCDKILNLKRMRLIKIPAKADAQQRHLKANLNSAEYVKHREDLVKWMEHITTNEAAAKTSDAELNAPIQ